MSKLPTLPPIRTILAATDLSEASKPALQAAMRVAQDYGAELHVVHVQADPPTPLQTVLFDDFREKCRQSALAEYESWCADLPDSDRPQLEIRFGNPVDEILREIDRLKADLLVVGTHGRTGLQHLALGSIAEQLGQTAHIDVLLVRPPFEGSFDRPMVALNTSEAARRATTRALEYAQKLPGNHLDSVTAFELPFGWHVLGKSVEVVTDRVRDHLEEKLEPTFEALRQAPTEVDLHLREGPAAKVMLQEIEDNRIDVLFLGSHNRPAWTSMLLGDTARVMAHKAHCSVWLVRDLAEKKPLWNAIREQMAIDPASGGSL